MPTGDRAILNAAGVGEYREHGGSRVAATGDRCDVRLLRWHSVWDRRRSGTEYCWVRGSESECQVHSRRGAGALSNLGRNTFNSPYFNVWNMSILKNNQFTERFNLHSAVDAFDVLNHRQYTFGQLRRPWDQHQRPESGVCKPDQWAAAFLEPVPL